jgi:hypothetical protein
MKIKINYKTDKQGAFVFIDCPESEETKYFLLSKMSVDKINEDESLIILELESNKMYDDLEESNSKYEFVFFVAPINLPDNSLLEDNELKGSK